METAVEIANLRYVKSQKSADFMLQTKHNLIQKGKMTAKNENVRTREGSTSKLFK
jgi:hypothetical protein